jgi:hypothetical protein
MRQSLHVALFAAAMLLASLPATPTRAQSGGAISTFPSDAMFVGLVEIWVGNELRGTGILMDDEAHTVVTAKDTVDGARALGLTVRMSGEGYSQKAEVVAYERTYGLALIWMVMPPVPGVRTNIPAMPPAAGEHLTLMGCFCVLYNNYNICQEIGVGFGDVLVESADGGELPHPYGPPTPGLIVVKLPVTTTAPITGGMGVFSPTTDLLVGIVTKVYSDRLIVVPVNTITAMLRSFALRKPKSKKAP